MKAKHLHLVLCIAGTARRTSSRSSLGSSRELPKGDSRTEEDGSSKMATLGKTNLEPGHRGYAEH